jgi:hypothetical protein
MRNVKFWALKALCPSSCILFLKDILPGWGTAHSDVGSECSIAGRGFVGIYMDAIFADFHLLPMNIFKIIL